MNGGTIGGRSAPRLPSPARRSAVRDGDPGDQRREQHHARELDDDRRRECDARLRSTRSRRPGRRRGRCAPTHAPNCSSSRPSGPRSGGSTTIASVPHSVTRATENATSSSSASMTPFAAAIAETPQIEKPVATSSERSSEMPRRRPAQRVPKNVIADDGDDDRERLDAEREDVREDEVEAEQDDAELEHRACRASAGRALRPPARGRRWRRATPSATQRTSGGSAGSARWAPSETATPAPARASPGARRIIRPAGGTGSGSPSAARASP